MDRSTPRPILLVDDDPAARDALAMLLRVKGHAVVTANNGREALDTLEHTEPCVILLDYAMSVMDARQFRAAQKADARWADIPVVLVTAHDVRGFDAVAVFRKPVTYDMLAPVLRACEAGSPRRS